MREEAIMSNLLLNKPLEFWVHTPELQKSDKGGRRLIRGYASVSTLDRQNEVIALSALEDAKNHLLENFTVFYEHKHSEFPIGKVVDAKIDDKGLLVEVELSTTADKIWTLIQEGILHCFSIGGRVLEAKEVKNEDTGKAHTEITKIELFEVSIVGLPANAEAQFELVSKSFNTAIAEEIRKREEENKVTEESKKVEESLVEKDLTTGKLSGKDEKPKEEKVEDPKEEPKEENKEEATAEVVEPKKEEVEEKPAEETPKAEEPKLEDVQKPEESEKSTEISDDKVVKSEEETIEKEEETKEAENVEKADWTTAFINDLPDSAFAAIEPAYRNGDTEDKRARHLPHHDAAGDLGGDKSNANLDLPHYRNALARVNQIKPITDSISAEDLRKKAAAHLERHRDALEAEEKKSELAAVEDDNKEKTTEPEVDKNDIIIDLLRQLIEKLDVISAKNEVKDENATEKELEEEAKSLTEVTEPKDVETKEEVTETVEKTEEKVEEPKEETIEKKEEAVVSEEAKKSEEVLEEKKKVDEPKKEESENIIERKGLKVVPSPYDEIKDSNKKEVSKNTDKYWSNLFFRG